MNKKTYSTLPFESNVSFWKLRSTLLKFDYEDPIPPKGPEEQEADQRFKEHEDENQEAQYPQDGDEMEGNK